VSLTPLPAHVGHSGGRVAQLSAQTTKLLWPFISLVMRLPHWNCCVALFNLTVQYLFSAVLSQHLLCCQKQPIRTICVLLLS